MENLMESLFMDNVPESWTKLAYPSQLGLAAWFSDLCLRLTELENWSGDFNVSERLHFVRLFRIEIIYFSFKSSNEQEEAVIH